MDEIQTSTDFGRTASRRPEKTVTGKSAASSKVHPHITCASRRLHRRMVPLRSLRYPNECGCFCFF
ncbi:hypothetical protein D7X87_01925 [bacterium D16-54]|nr:hypothetical protein D7X87_01925 [bacterium D16-54]RKJ16420.1 hypothetical protein D7X65_01925 [bacterium D16-56]